MKKIDKDYGNMKKILGFSILLVFICCSGILCANSRLKPNKCPSIEAIKTSGFNTVKPALSELTWFVIQQNNNYDTNLSWDFFILVEAENENTAMKKATAELQSLYLYDGPIGGENDTWSCIYANDSNNSPIAITPTGTIPTPFILRQKN